MGLSFMSNENYYPNLKVLNGGLENTFSDVDDIVNYFKQQRREKPGISQVQFDIVRMMAEPENIVPFSSGKRAILSFPSPCMVR